MQQLDERVTTEELAEALSDRVTAEAMAEALAGRMPVVKAQEGRPEPNSFGVVTGLSGNYGAPIYGAPLISFGAPGYEAQIILGGIGAWEGAWNRIYFRNRNGDSGAVSDWKEFYHSGNFAPGKCFAKRGYGMISDEARYLTEPGMYSNLDYPEWPGALLHFAGSGSLSAIQIKTPGNGSVDTQIRFQTDGRHDRWSDWYRLYHSGNLTPTYSAQIDPNGNITHQTGDWIQSVKWVSDFGDVCVITPKPVVNIYTAQVTVATSAMGGNNFQYLAPVVKAWDLSEPHEIMIFIPGTDGRNKKMYFNISIQGA